MSKTNINNGFTLIELLVVIGIIAVLTGLVTFNFSSARARARDVQRKNDLKAVQQALEIYRSDNDQAFPEAPETWDAFMTLLINSSVISKGFVDPKEALTANSWTQYSYSRPTGLTYTLVACLENRSDSDAVQPIISCGQNNTGVTFSMSQP